MMVKHAMQCKLSHPFLSQVLSSNFWGLPFSGIVPGVQKIVYSTCSIHATENEAVVRDSLSSDEAARGRFSLAPSDQVLPQWHRRGLADVLESPSQTFWLTYSTVPVSCFLSGQTASLVRCSPGDDATNGFFVSCFVRGQKRKSDLVHDHDHEVVVPKKKRRNQRKRF